MAHRAAACSPRTTKETGAGALSLLAALEGRLRAAIMLIGYAAADYARGGTQRLPVYQRCGDAAEALAAQRLALADIAGLRERGRAWAEAGIATLAFAAADVEVAELPPPSVA